MFESRVTPVDPQVEIENLRKSYENLNTRYDAQLTLNEQNQALKEELRDKIGTLKSANESLTKDVNTFDTACEYNKTKAANYLTDLKIFESAMRNTIDRQEWCHEEANLAIETMNREFVSDFQIDLLTQEYESEIIVEANVRVRRTVTNIAGSQEEADGIAVEQDTFDMTTWAIEEVQTFGWDSIDAELVY